ncbi:MAG: hypothetical protein A2X86_15385 [Bdellovibrionales bacterium GWA2_49_15]|nr:MAG: hypothetical protein A2X86_15385 [Bdellovibrionales bacterium GWA2_49_15]HAZ14512.1 hypothetical protein [Bdellovibrionales bacterium]
MSTGFHSSLAKQGARPASVCLFLLCLLLMAGCQDQASRKGQAKIKDFSVAAGTTDPGICTDYISGDLTECVKACASDERLATHDEITAIIASIKSTSGLSTEEEKELGEMISQSKGVCIEEIKRPDKAVFVKSDYCACQNTTPLILNNCLGFCSSKNTGGEKFLFVNVNLDPAIELNASLGTLKNWCGKEIGDGLVRPACKLELRDSSGTMSLDIKPELIGNKNFTVDIKSISKNVTYVARIVESSSGAASDEFQIRAFDYVATGNPPTGPLKVMPASQYSCINRAGSAGVDGFNWTQALRMHFYFAVNKSPPSLPPLTSGQSFCHDINLFGINDSPIFPRLELVPQQFATWDESDSRFVDTDGNQKEDVNDEMQKRLLDEYGVTRTVKVFMLLRWPNYPGSGAGTGVHPGLGYIMQPWTSPLSGRAFCPTQEHYNGTDPLFRVMKEVIGVDTEGLYLAEREPLVMVGSGGGLSQAPQDVLLVRENLLRKVWFYYENGQHFIPNDVTAGQKTIMFYWPPDIVNPYIRKSTQYIYTVKAPGDIGGAATASGSGLQTSIKPPDKRLGCIPSVGPAQDEF